MMNENGDDNIWSFTSEKRFDWIHAPGEKEEGD